MGTGTFVAVLIIGILLLLLISIFLRQKNKDETNIRRKVRSTIPWPLSDGRQNPLRAVSRRGPDDDDSAQGGAAHIQVMKKTPLALAWVQQLVPPE